MPNPPRATDLCCYDCGSKWPHLHTELCDLAPEGSTRSLPQVPGTQHWNRLDPVTTSFDDWMANLAEQHSYCDTAEAFEVAKGDPDGILGSLAEQGHTV